MTKEDVRIITSPSVSWNWNKIYLKKKIKIINKAEKRISASVTILLCHENEQFCTLSKGRVMKHKGAWIEVLPSERFKTIKRFPQWWIYSIIDFDKLKQNIKENGYQCNYLTFKETNPFLQKSFISVPSRSTQLAHSHLSFCG